MIFTDSPETNPYLSADDLPGSFGGAIDASMRSALYNSPVMQINRTVEDYNAGGPLLDYETAREKARAAGVDIRIDPKGMQQGQLDLLIQRKRFQAQTQDALARGPHGFAAGSAYFLSGLGAAMLDPINLATAFIPVARGIGMAEDVARAGMVGEAGAAATAMGRASARARVGAVEGAVGQALVEPLTYYRATQEQEDYGITDTLLNVGFGTVLGAVAHVGLGALGDKVAAAERERKAKDLIDAANNLPDGTVGAVGEPPRIPTKPYSEEDLTAVGAHGNSKRLAAGNMVAEDSADMPKATYAEMKALKAADYSTSERVSSARRALGEAFGADVAAGLEKSGRIKLIDSVADLPEALRQTGDHNTLYDPLTDTTFVLADKVNSKNIRGVIMQDVGVRQGLERVVGTDLYNQMIASVDKLAANGDAAAIKALERAKNDGGPDFLKNESKLAYFIEHAGGKVQGIFRQAIAAIKAYLVKHFGMDINFNEKDLAALVEGSVKKVALDKHFGTWNNNFPYVWHGGPVKGIEKLSQDFVGTGEGNVNQGWGLYTTSSKFTGNWYRVKEAAARGLTPEEGGLYQLKVNPDVTRSSFLQWDSTSQSREVQKALESQGVSTEGKTGREIYFELMGKAPGDTPLEKAKAVSQALDAIGIHGTEYATGNTRNKNVKSSNFVFYSDRHFEIVRRNEGGTMVEVAPDSAAAKMQSADMATVAAVFRSEVAANLDGRLMDNSVLVGNASEGGVDPIKVQQAAAASHLPENDVHYDAQAKAEVDASIAEHGADVDPAEAVTRAIQEAQTELATLSKQLGLDPENNAAMRDADELASTASRYSKAIEAYASCQVRS
jgi:hypothetical protein